MGLRSLIALVSLLSVGVLGVSGCSKDAQKIAPDTRGKRGETCLARNDCDTGLACLNGICAKNEFNLDVTAKQCTRVECDVDKDCCGDRPTTAPKKCAGRDEKCNPAKRLVPGCVQTLCTSDATCNGGTCAKGTCLGSGQAGTMCDTAADCLKNTCVIPAASTSGSCSLTFSFCDALTPCPQATCSTRSCDCVNPAYDPSDPICADTDCDDVCLLTCQDSLCVEDKSCKADADCVAVGLKTCDSDGRCIECTTSKDCDTKNGETCEKGLCHKPCTQNEECGLFEACQDGDCTYVGCQSDRECILAAARGSQIQGGGTGGSSSQAAASSSADDPRLYKCLASDADPKIKVCKIPCENDGSCGQFQACDAGFCKFVGCNTDEECRDYLGIANQMTSDTKPYVATAKCVAPAAPTKTP